MLIFLFILVNSASNLFETLALDQGFHEIPHSQSTCSYNDLSCYNLLCNMLNNTSMCASSIMLAPLSKIFDCTKLPSHNRNANIVIFSIDMFLNIMNTTICKTVNDCLMTGCNMYVNSANEYGPVYIGQCL